MAIKYAACSETHDGYSWTLEPWKKKGLRFFSHINDIPQDYYLVVTHFAPWWAPLKEWIAAGRPWIEIEYGYWGPLNPKREIRRVTYRGHHNLNIKPRPYSRTNEFPEPPVLPWRTSLGEYIIIPMPVEKYLIQRTGQGLEAWKQKMLDAIKPYWSGSVLWREKVGKTSRFETFKTQLENAYAVVGERTMSCTEAVLLGVPGFTIDSSMSSLIMGGIENLANPLRPDRTDWYDHICWSQFNVEEFSKGTLVADLVEQYQM